jgi:hypothetical protein
LTGAGVRNTGLAGAVPVPVRGTVCGLLASLSETLKVAVSAPVMDGVKTMLIVHVAPTAIVPPQFELVTRKSAAFGPVNEAFTFVNPLWVRLASVTTRGWLVTPTM